MTPKESYDAIVKEMKALVEQLENNPTMSEEKYAEILKRYGKLGKLLEEYSKSVWYR